MQYLGIIADGFLSTGEARKLGANFGYDGSKPTLRGAIARHCTPLEKADKCNPDGSFALNIKQISAVSPVLVPTIQISEGDIGDLRAFLAALSYLPTDIDIIVSRSVPSGLPIEYQ